MRFIDGVTLAFTLLYALFFTWVALSMPPIYRNVLSSRHWPLACRWWWRIGWMAGAVMALAVWALRVRNATDASLYVPASAPLLDHVLAALVLVCFISLCAALGAWRVALTRHERRMRRAETGR